MLNLYPLKHRPLRGDSIETYKITIGVEDVDAAVFFQRESTETLRGHEDFSNNGPTVQTDSQVEVFLAEDSKTH